MKNKIPIYIHRFIITQNVAHLRCTLGLVYLTTKVYLDRHGSRSRSNCFQTVNLRIL